MTLKTVLEIICGGYVTVEQKERIFNWKLYSWKPQVLGWSTFCERFVTKKVKHNWHEIKMVTFGGFQYIQVTSTLFLHLTALWLWWNLYGPLPVHFSLSYPSSPYGPAMAKITKFWVLVTPQGPKELASHVICFHTMLKLAFDHVRMVPAELPSGSL